MLQNNLSIYTVLNGGGGGEGFVFLGFALVLPTLTLYVKLRMNDVCEFLKCCLGAYSSFIIHKYSHIHRKILSHYLHMNFYHSKVQEGETVMHNYLFMLNTHLTSSLY